jgi:hypothetical protein
MAKVIDFNQYRSEEQDISTMDKDALLSYLDQLRARIEQLVEAEPKNMNSEAYEEWGDLHEELEDLVDDILDRLEEME